jgi:hypothetical protein
VCSTELIRDAIWRALLHAISNFFEEESRVERFGS